MLAVGQTVHRQGQQDACQLASSCCSTGQNLSFICNAWHVEKRWPPPETPEKDFWEELEGTPEGAMLKNDTTFKLYEHEEECVDSAVNSEDLGILTPS